MAFGAGDGFGWSLVGLHFGFGNDTRGTAPAGGEDFALGADEQNPIVAHFSFRFEFIRAWGHQAAVIPGDIYRSLAVSGGELVAIEAGSGIRFRIEF